MSGGLKRQMGDVIHIGDAAASPDMTVIELAIILALLRDSVGTAASLAPLLSRWFDFPLEPAHLTKSIHRMIVRNWLRLLPDGGFVPAIGALEPTRTLYPGLIRMLGDILEPGSVFAEMQHFLDSMKENKP